MSAAHKLIAGISLVFSVVGIIVMLRLLAEALSPCGNGVGGCGANDGFAREYFEGLVPFDEVLESRRDMPRDGQFDLKSSKRCSFAIVRLAASAPVEPPRPRMDLRGRSYRWGRLSNMALPTIGQSRQTFINAFEACAREWRGETRRLVGFALKDPGSYVSDGFPPGEYYLYSVAHQLAMRLRYGV